MPGVPSFRVSMEYLILGYCEERGITRWEFDALPVELQVGPLAVRLARQRIEAWQSYESRKRSEFRRD